MATLSLRELTKRYGSFLAIPRIDLEVGDGELLVLVGPSGCGKSTLLRMIAGLEEVTGGDVLLDGCIVTHAAPRERDVAMVFQDYALYPHMSVADNLGFGLRMRGAPAARIDARVDEIAGLLGIDHLLDRRPGQLSGGQRQRVALGRAMAREPKLFLFDEPLSNLDAKLRGEMRTEIKRMQRRVGTTSVYVTHDQIEAMTLADRIVVMREGVIQQIGPPAEVYGRPANAFVAAFFGSPPMNLVPVVAGGGSVALAGHPVAPAPGGLDGRALTLGVRPEDLALRPPGKGVPARVELVEPQGADTVVVVRVGEAELLARVDGASGPREGEAVALAFDPARLHLFDTETSARIEGVARTRQTEEVRP